MQKLTPQRESRIRRNGFTLMEILLVLALLLVLSAVTWPAFSAMLGRRRVDLAVSDVQVLLGAARVRAAESGVTYQFRYETGGRRYVLVPADAAELVAVAETPGTDVVTAASQAWKRQGQLPETVSFAEASDQVAAADPVAMELLSGLDSADELARAGWGPAILFHPDGTASDSQFVVADEDDSMTITVRGLTGASRSSTTIEEE